MEWVFTVIQSSSNTLATATLSLEQVLPPPRKGTAATSNDTEVTIKRWRMATVSPTVRVGQQQQQGHEGPVKQASTPHVALITYWLRLCFAATDSIEWCIDLTLDAVILHIMMCKLILVFIIRCNRICYSSSSSLHLTCPEWTRNCSQIQLPASPLQLLSLQRAWMPTTLHHPPV